MTPVWKCTRRCPFAPCYLQCDGSESRGAFGEREIVPPSYCPHTGEAMSPDDFEVAAQEANPWSIRWIDRLQEWISGEGYDNAPEEIRDALAIDLHGRLDRYDAAHVIGLLRDYEDDYVTGFEREELAKKLNKLTKWELINAIFPEAFKAGVIYAEELRQRREADHA